MPVLFEGRGCCANPDGVSFSGEKSKYRSWSQPRSQTWSRQNMELCTQDAGNGPCCKRLILLRCDPQAELELCSTCVEPGEIYTSIGLCSYWKPGSSLCLIDEDPPLKAAIGAFFRRYAVDLILLTEFQSIFLSLSNCYGVGSHVSLWKEIVAELAFSVASDRRDRRLEVEAVFSGAL
ncbi:hypothetical protein L1049_023900 [Liquidambar formosana]|uniref:Uncharacterized protein n=1 Tax=Liquidambar formosana TaxID=63359 RepID=A0AAP0X3Z0_LIQFO